MSPRLTAPCPHCNKPNFGPPSVASVIGTAVLCWACLDASMWVHGQIGPTLRALTDEERSHLDANEVYQQLRERVLSAETLAQAAGLGPPSSLEGLYTGMNHSKE